MFNAVIRFALRYRLLVLVISMALMVYGSYLATQMPIDVFPDLDRPRVIIITECPGLATEEVETLVTQPIEVALLGASGVQAVRSQSTAGLNVIYVEFDWNTEIRAARQTVQERLSTLGSVLPEGILPQMTPPAGWIFPARPRPITETFSIFPASSAPRVRPPTWPPPPRPCVAWS